MTLNQGLVESKRPSMIIATLRTCPEYLALLSGAGDLTKLVEDPDDEQTRSEIYRQLQMNLALGYFLYFGASAEHPDWMPVARRMRKRILANPEGGHGEHVYTPEQFGLSAAMIREHFADYLRRYQ